MNTEMLKREIEDQFTFVDKPEGLAISFHEDDCHQCEFLREELEKYCEQELPEEGIRDVHVEMSCLSAQGWRWALPSYLRYCLTDEALLTEQETQFLIYNLAPGVEYQSETTSRLSLLSDGQIHCLVHFLEWCREHEHWGKYFPQEISSGIVFLSALRE